MSLNRSAVMMALVLTVLGCSSGPAPERPVLSEPTQAAGESAELRSWLEELQARNPRAVKRNKDGVVIRIALGESTASNDFILRASECKTLESFSVSCTQEVTPDGVLPILGVGSLRELSLMRLRGAVRSEFLKGLSQLPKLETLRLDHVRIDPDGLDVLSRLENLRQLYLIDSGIREKDLAVIAQAKNLEYLDVSGNGLSEESLLALGGAGKLKTLRANDVEMHDAVRRALSRVRVFGKGD